MVNVAKKNSETDGLAFLLDAFTHEQKGLEAQINAAHATITHDGVMGNVIEARWIKGFLSRYLPDRYKIDSGIVIDSRGHTSDQIDIVIYDNQYTPSLLIQEGHRFIPAESVYAVLEVKPEINKKNLEYAANKAASVRTLHRTSVGIRHAGGTYPAKPLHEIICGLVAHRSGWSDGLGDSFKETIKSLAAEMNTTVDCGCVLEAGSFDLFDYDHVFMHDPQFDMEVFTDKLHLKEAGHSLVYFMFRLLSRLQAIGTVPAVDWREYASVFKS